MRGSKGDLPLPSQSAQWHTPTTQAAKGVDYQMVGGKKVLILDGQAKAHADMWPTPASRDYRTPNLGSLESRGGGSKGEQLPNFVEHHFLHPVLSIHDGKPLSPTARTLPRRLNPAFACWLMGWPIWWTNPALTNSAKSAMESYRCRLQQQLLNLCGEPASTERKAA